MVERRRFLGVLSACMAQYLLPIDLESEMSNATGNATEQRTVRHAQDGLVLSTEFRLEREALILEYEARNTSQEDVYLLNRLYRSIPKLSIDPNLIYIRLDSSMAAVFMQKKIDDIPSDRNVLAPVSPFITPVRAGGQFTERVIVPLPVHQYREYNVGPDTSTGAPRTFHQVSFTLGYYWSAPGSKENVKVLGGVEVVLPQLPPGTKVRWGVVDSGQVNLEIPVLDPHGAGVSG